MPQSKSDTTGDIKLRRMRLSDVAAVAHIEVESYPDPWPQEDFADWLGYAGMFGHVLVDESHNEDASPHQKDKPIAGFVLTESTRAHLHIGDIAVSPKYRRRGLASVLILHTVALAKRIGKTAVTLEVRASNDAAIRCYKALGFKRQRRLKNYYLDGEDGIFMSLRLR